MIRFIYVKTTTLYNNNKTNYANDIVLVGDTNNLYVKGALVNAAFGKITSDGTNTYAASNYNSTLKIVGSNHVTVTAASTGFTVKDTVTLGTGDNAGEVKFCGTAVKVKGYSDLASTVSEHTSTLSSHTTTLTQHGNTIDTLLTKVNTDLPEEIRKQVASVYKVKGTKATYADLPTSNNTEGDVWNVTAAYGNTPAGTNWVWVKDTSLTAEGYWDPLGGTVDLSAYVNDLINGPAVTNQVVSGITKSGSQLTVAHRALTSNDIPSLAISKITNLQSTLDDKVPKGRTVNSKALSSDITLGGADIIVGGSSTFASNTIAEAFNTAEQAWEGYTDGVIQNLDVANIGGTGKYIQVVGETNGKITATAQDLKAGNVTATAISASTTSVAVTGTTVEAQIKSLASSIKTTSGTAGSAIQTVTATGSGSLSLSASVSGTTAAITGSLEWIEVTS